jgi:glycosyltransferase involved in cell wall biosynthesis
VSPGDAILAFPRDGNPYQELLYGPLREQGIAVRYAGELTPSRTLNLMLLPAELAVARVRGARTLHLHWSFGFRWRVGPAPVSARLSSAWFRLCLGVAKALRLRIVWTAHNVLPHDPVFADDVAEGRRLVAAADAVIAHSESAADELRRTLGTPRSLTVIPHGRFEDAPAPAESAPPGDGPVRALFAGAITGYKGVEDLLSAFARVRDETTLTLTIAGRPSDDALAERLRALAGERVTLRLQRVPDAELAALLAGHDVVVLPFRRITTSGSVLLALGAGRAVAVSDLPAFAGLPVRRFEPGAAGIAEALRTLDRTSRAELRAEGDRARAWADTLPGWPAIAERTATVLLPTPSASATEAVR